MSPRLRLFVLAVVALGGVLLFLHLPADLEARWGDYALWIVICAISELMIVSTLSGQGTVSMSSTASLATVVLWGQGPSMWIAAVSSLVAELLLVRKKPWVRAVFNSGQIAITLWMASHAFAWLGGPLGGVESVGGASLTGSGALRLVAPILGLSASYLLVNRALVGVAVSWSTDRPYLKVLREDWFYAERLFEDTAGFFLAPLMVISYRAIGYPGVLLFYAPLYMMYQSSRRYVELRNTQNQMIHSERMAAKGEMAAEIGHELRNQLVAISGRAQMLLKDAERRVFENAHRHAQIILEQSRRMESLSKGLMDFSSAELNVERVDVNALIQRSVEFVRTQNRFDGVEWEFRLGEHVPELRADPGQLQQVLINLLLNAADAMTEKGAGRKVLGIISEWEERSRMVRLTVTDTGTGIAPSNLSRIFEPHFTTKPEGHGFGLSTSYRIITNHGGRITVESPPGRGARFTVTLPLHGPGAWS